MNYHYLVLISLLLAGCEKLSSPTSPFITNKSFSLKEHLIKGDKGSECTLPDLNSIEQYKPIISVLANTKIGTPSDKLQIQLLQLKTTSESWKTAEKDDIGNIQGYITKAIVPIRPLGSRSDIGFMIVNIKYDKFEQVSDIIITAGYGLFSDKQKTCDYSLFNK